MQTDQDLKTGKIPADIELVQGYDY